MDRDEGRERPAHRREGARPEIDGQERPGETGGGGEGRGREGEVETCRSAEGAGARDAVRAPAERPDAQPEGEEAGQARRRCRSVREKGLGVPEIEACKQDRCEERERDDQRADEGDVQMAPALYGVDRKAQSMVATMPAAGRKVM